MILTQDPHLLAGNRPLEGLQTSKNTRVRTDCDDIAGAIRKKPSTGNKPEEEPQVSRFRQRIEALGQ